MNITEFEIMSPIGLITYVLIDRGNGEFTSMTKAHYEAQQEHLTENPTA